MRTKVLTLFMLLLTHLCTQPLWADNIDIEGEWDDEYYRMIVPAPPVLSIDGNLLSIHFIDALEDLTVQVVNEQGAILYNEIVSGEAGESVSISISLDQAGTGRFYVVLEHRLGQLTGEFVIQNN